MIIKRGHAISDDDTPLDLLTSLRLRQLLHPSEETAPGFLSYHFKHPFSQTRNDWLFFFF